MRLGMKILVLFCLLIFVVATGLVTYLTVTEYRPEAIEEAEMLQSGVSESATLQNNQKVLEDRTLRIITWNTGYGGLGKDADFFMDGGEGVQPETKEIVQNNLEGIAQELETVQADIVFLQEVDVEAKRSFGINQWQYYWEKLQLNSAFAPNYRCNFVPYPWPPIGKVDSGLATFTDFSPRQAVRIQLPSPFSWPVRTANLKRCLLVSYIPLDDSEKELVLVNLHLEAYDDGEGKAEQTRQFWKFVENEYAKGNYVIAGGDFNQTFPGALDAFPIRGEADWEPGMLQATLPEGWQYAYDTQPPSCRLLDKPYDAETTQHYVIDGFLLSPNIEIQSVETKDLGFVYTDHNPVYLEVTLQ